MIIRPVTPGDAEAIERIRIRGWQAAYRHVFPPEELDRMPASWSWWHDRIVEAAPRHAYLVAVEAGALLGFAVTGPSRGGPEREGELYAIYVEPGSWSRGVGRALIERAEEELALDWDEAVLWTLRDSARARRFYELSGWEADGGEGTFDRLGVSAAIVRYRKRLSRSTSRA